MTTRFTVIFIWAVFFSAGCSFDETGGPDRAPQNGLGPESRGGQPTATPKIPGPLTGNVTEECEGVRNEIPKPEGEAIVVLTVKSKDSQPFSKVIMSDPSSVIYLRSQFQIFQSGLYSIEVTNEDGSGCWFATEVSSTGNHVEVVLGLKTITQ